MRMGKHLSKIFRKPRKIIDDQIPAGTNISQYIHPLLGSYSQYGEDLIIDVLLNGKKLGTYVDIGANDPLLFSNTARFYKRGWSGINIEPDNNLYRKICQERQRDINLNIGVGPVNDELTFYKSSANTLSSFNKQAAMEGGRIHGATIISTHRTVVRRLVDILDEFMPNKQIEFLSVDVEGFDLEVLQSNDWGRYRPNLLIIEINQGGSAIISFLKQCDYKLIYSNGTNGIFIDAALVDEKDHPQSEGAHPYYGSSNR